MDKKRIKLLLVEDHDSVSLGVIHSLNEARAFEFEIKTASNADEAYDYLKKNQFDVVLLDLILKNRTPRSEFIGGDDLLREINKMKRRPKVIVMSKIDSLDMLDYIINVLQSNGYILKSRTSLQEIIPAMECVLEGDTFFSPSIERLMKYNQNLLDIDFSDRIILRTLSEGMKQNDVVSELKSKKIIMTVSAIEKRVRKLKAKFEAKTTTQLIAMAIKKGII